MSRLGGWTARWVSAILPVLAVVLVFVAYWLPKWALVPLGLLVGAGVWNTLYVAQNRRLMDKTFADLRVEMREKIASLSNGKHPLFNLRINSIPDQPDHLKVDWELAHKLDPFQIRRAVMVLRQTASELDHVADTMVETGTDEYPGRQNPSMN